MKRALGCFFLAMVGLSVFGAASPRIETRMLGNGLRCIVIQFQGSTNVAIFTYSPLSLSTDGAGQAQWSHLVEHMVLRSTILEDHTKANAETLPDHMRLDYYGNLSDWKEGLSHHRLWIECVPCTHASTEKE